MSGALSERVFVKKLTNVGFDHVRIVERHPFTLEDAARYPLFTPDLISLMRRLLSPAQQREVAVALTVTARRPPDGATAGR